MTPVTQADIECEKAIREIVEEKFPEHGFFGEESGQTQIDAEYLLVGGSDRRYQELRSAIPVLLNSNSAYEPWRADPGSLKRCDDGGTRLGGARPGRLVEW